MPLVKYRIYELSARAVISYGRQQECAYAFHLSAAETEKCKSLSAPHEQDDNALFYQIMCVLHGDAFTGTPGGQLVTDLSDIIFYMDFSGIFDRSGARKKHLIRQEKAKALFRPEGVSLDFGSGAHRYLAFERSGSMSRQARLSFIREDFYDAVRRRIMMDMTIGDCQLSKLYAYNGLMLSSGIRIDGIGIDRPHRVVVVGNPVRTPPPTEVITVEDDGTQNSTRKYHRVETMADVEVTCFDGEGLISKQYARLIDEKLCGKKVHTSFQIRMPYEKGMLHEVDFKDYLDRGGADTITDLWGVEHPIQKVDIILTKSMFKGCGWLNESGMSWEDYWAVFRKYRHALYITNVSKEKPEKTTELNYQFLNTVSLKADEFRPADLPDGWDHSPETDERNWLTKQTELAYYNFCADESFRQNYFLEKFERVSWWERHQGKDQILAAVLKKNLHFINEPIYAKRLEVEADKIAEQYAVGRLIVAGDNRYLSGDLLDFLNCLPVTKTGTSKKANTFINFRWALELNHQNFFAPGAAYESGHVCTLLRNPHIARNEEMQLYSGATNFRKTESNQRAVVFHLLRFRQFFPILTISASAKVIVAAVHGARTTAAKLESMDSFAFDDVPAFFAPDCVPDNSRHNHSPFSAFLIFSFSPLPSVRRRRNGTAHFSKTEFFFISRSACLLPASWKPVPSTSTASTGRLSI